MVQPKPKQLYSRRELFISHFVCRTISCIHIDKQSKLCENLCNSHSKTELEKKFEGNQIRWIQNEFFVCLCLNLATGIYTNTSTNTECHEVIYLFILFSFGYDSLCCVVLLTLLLIIDKVLRCIHWRRTEVGGCSTLNTKKNE